MKKTTEQQLENEMLEEIVGFTPAMLAERKPTLGDLPRSDYNHETQTREFLGGEKGPSLLPDTLFDGESS